METGKETKTLLEQKIDSAAARITRAIEEAIESGAVISKQAFNGKMINGIYVQKAYPQQKDYDAVIVLHLKSEIIKDALRDDEEELKRMRKELQDRIDEIDNELNEAKQ